MPLYMPNFCLGCRWPILRMAQTVNSYTKKPLAIEECIVTWPIGLTNDREDRGEMRFHFDGNNVRIVNTLTRKEEFAYGVSPLDVARLDLGESSHGLTAEQENQISIIDRAIQSTFWATDKERWAFERKFFKNGNFEQQGYQHAH